MKNIMIIGASKGQKAIIDACKELGYQSIVVSPKGNYPGLKEANVTIFVDVTDKKKILTEAKGLSIDAVITDQLDLAVPSVAYVAENLNLPSIGYETSLIFQNKDMMYTKARDCGLRILPFIIAESKNDLLKKIYNDIFPAILKPADGESSRGIFKVYNQYEIEKYFDESFKYSRNGKVVLQKFVKGTEYVVESLVSEGIVKPLIIGETTLFDFENFFIPSSRIFISADSKINTFPFKDDVLVYNKSIITKFNLRFGIVHAEYFVTDDGTVYLCEIAARGGGAYTSSVILSSFYNDNFSKLLISLAINGKIDLDFSLQDKVVSYFSFLLNEGEIVDVNNVEGLLNSHSQVIFSDIRNINYVVGTKTSCPYYKGSRQGPIVMQCNLLSDVNAQQEFLKKSILIKIKNNDGNISDVIW